MKQLLAWIAALLIIGCNDSPKPPPTTTTNSTAKTVAKPIIDTTQLNWPDRRPIGMVMLANYVTWTDTDNYMNEDYISVAKNCIDNMRAINAQGLVVWDPEGQKWPRAYTYYGDPKLAPEKVNPFFKAIIDAGYRVGVCLRPDVIRWKPTQYWSKTPTHYVVNSPLDNLIDKIEYARDRWGCTLFYVDSNVGVGQGVGTDNTQGYGGLMPASLFADLAKLFPGCLFMPEHENNEYYQYTAPYNDKGFRPLLIPGENGFQVLNVAESDFPLGQLKKSVDQGNILMGRVWYESPELEIIKKAYK